jgi:cytosine/adenosine deaminase-related metal-dependent hydrolase
MLRARWVLPEDGPPIEGGFVAIADGRIASVDAHDPGRSPVEDLGDVILLPGVVEAHTQLEFSDQAGPVGAAGMALPAWIRLVIADRRRGDRDVAAAIERGLAESLRCGVTSIGEIATAPARALLDAKPEALGVVAFQEVIGFSRGRIDSVAGELERRLDAAGVASGISPHAPYTVHPELLRRLVGIASERDLPVAMHLAESREELELLRDGGGPFKELLEERSMWDAEAIPRGSRPLDYLRVLAEAPRALVVHGNYLDAEEFAYLAEHRRRMSVAYCPRTHDYFRHAPYPLAAMLASGARVALGTDSRASNPDLDVLAEVRFAANRHPDVPAAQWVRMATLDGAVALGRGDEAGSLAAGKRADLTAIACDSGDDAYEQIVRGTGRCVATWTAGKLAVTGTP